MCVLVIYKRAKFFKPDRVIERLERVELVTWLDGDYYLWIFKYYFFKNLKKLK